MKALMSLTFFMLVATNSGFAYGEYESREALASALNPTSPAYVLNDEWKVMNRINELYDLEARLTSDISSTPDDPELWLLRGLVRRIQILTLRATEWKGMSREEYFSSPEFTRLMHLVVQDYLKAFELAERKDGLSPDMAYIITQDTLLDPRVNEKVIRYEMKVTREPPTETYYEDSYQAMYESYVQHGRYDDALRILAEMSEEFPENAEQINRVRQGVAALRAKSLIARSDQDSLEKEVEGRAPQEHARKDELRESTPTEPSAGRPQESRGEFRENIFIWFGLFSLTLIIMATALFLRRKQQR